jgi:hypothetical protein
MLEEAGLADRVSPLGTSASRLMMTWLAPLFERYGDLTDPRDGAVSIERASDEDVRSLLQQYAEDVGETVCGLWTFQGTAVEMLYADFVERFDDLWYPASTDVWLLSFLERRFVSVSHEEFVLFGDLGPFTRFPVWSSPER